MRLLLDTHIFLWTLGDDTRLSKLARDMIHDADEVFVSSATVWEASIKAGLGKLDVDIGRLVSEISLGGYAELPVRITHAAQVFELPGLHKDPFDRILIAQAMHEQLWLLTSDQQLAQYGEIVKLV